MRLHHNPISTCSQKVRLVLAEKQLPCEDALVDLQAGEQFAPAYVALNPNAVVPTLEHDGHVLIESTLINEYLDDAFPQPPLRPDAPAERHRMRLATKRLDDPLHAACGVLTYAIGVRPTLLARPREEVDALLDGIPDPRKRAARRSVVEQGVAAPEVVSALATHTELFDAFEAWLTESEWVAGAHFSLADCALAPYVLRVDHLALGPRFIAPRPALARWYDAMRARASWETAVARWLPAALVSGFRAAGEAVAAEIAVR